MGKKTNRAVLGFTTQAKKDALTHLGYTLLEYKGRINDAPTQIRHLVRDLQPGFYIVNISQRAIIKQLDTNASGHKFDYTTASMLSEQFKEVILWEMQSDYVYALKNDNGTFDFTGTLSEDLSLKTVVMNRLAHTDYKPGYYGVQIVRGTISWVSETYTVFENLLLDLALYSPVSPFAQFASQIVEHQFSELNLISTKFQFSGDAAITLTSPKNGKLVATVVNYPEIDGIEKLFVAAPKMLKLLLDLTNPSATNADIDRLKVTANSILGEVNI